MRQYKFALTNWIPPQFTNTAPPSLIIYLPKKHFYWPVHEMAVAVASWFRVRSTLERALVVWALAGDILLRSRAKPQKRKLKKLCARLTLVHCLQTFHLMRQYKFSLTNWIPPQFTNTATPSLEIVLKVCHKEEPLHIWWPKLWSKSWWCAYGFSIKYC